MRMKDSSLSALEDMSREIEGKSPSGCNRTVRRLETINGNPS
jgi:hypothetical protein